ncbi:serine hydrolase domain-containing protein [Xylocopilactobacillus apis]|uniref:Serine hydrolase n=1 Tax=Xylocopilactobacillus apis TaxID=2932183 RepID=A0AAU9DPS4_9LACO|nr:serine hydrolase domain-containing protein [Xylocopilactobacillus apis]BDR55533.1 serine hydrolase [Xylocopilactobacillus apis]
MKFKNIKIFAFIALGIMIGGGFSYVYYVKRVRPRHLIAQQQQVYTVRKQDQQKIDHLQEVNHQLAMRGLLEDENKEVIDRLSPSKSQSIDKLMDKNYYIGSALLFKDGQIVYKKGFGYSDYQTKKKNTSNSLYQWASLQKSITAVLIMKSVEEGNLKLTDHLSKFYPTVPGSQKITIRQMLNMTSGLSVKDGKPIIPAKDVIKDNISRTTFDQKKWNHAMYSPVNYVLMAGILEKVNDTNYYQLIQDKIFKPLKLKNVGFTSAVDWKPIQMFSYQTPTPKTAPYLKTIPTNPLTYTKELGTGNVYSTAQTLLETQLSIVAGKIISKDDLRTLRNTTGGYYAGGVYNYDDHFYSHGLIAGYETSMYITNDGTNAIILMSNRSIPYPDLKKSYSFISSLYNQMMK